MSLLLEKQLDLANIFKNELPKIDSKKIILPYSNFPHFPKNLMNEAVKVNEKFLDRYQGIIQDTFSKKQLELFQIYQNKHFSKHYLSSNKKENFFSNCKCKTKNQIYDVIIQSMNRPGSFMGFAINPFTLLPENTRFGSNIIYPYRLGIAGCTQSGDIEIGSQASTTSGWGPQVAAWAITTVDEECFDQMAADLNVAVGNINLAIYNDSSNPSTLLQDTGSNTSATGFPFNSCPETNFSGTTHWLALMNSSSSTVIYRATSGTRSVDDDDNWTFPTFNDPFDVDGGGAGTTFHLKVGHS